MYDYKSLVIRQALNEKKINAKGYKQPTVIGIVLYTGQRKWKKEGERKERDFKEYLKQNLIDYELVDANELNEEELLKEDTVLSKIILLERVNNIEELKEIIKKIMQEETNRETKAEITRYIIAVFSRNLKKYKKELKEVLENLGEEEKEMMLIDEVLIKERNSWLEEGKLKIIRKMVKNKIKDELIKECTDVNEKELNRIKKEMQSQAV